MTILNCIPQIGTWMSMCISNKSGIFQGLFGLDQLEVVFFIKTNENI